jgi:WG containing repeat
MVSPTPLKLEKVLLLALIMLSICRRGECQFSELDGEVIKTDNGALKPFVIMGKLGFTDQKSGRLIIPAGFDWIQKPVGKPVKYLIGIKRGKWGVIGVDGKELVPFQYDSIKDLSFSGPPRRIKLFGQQNGKWSLMPRDSGTTSSPASYDFICKANQDGFAKFKRGQKFGLIGLFAEKEIIPAAYDDLEFLNSNYIKFKQGQKFGLIRYGDTKEIIPSVYDNIEMHGIQIKAWLSEKVGVIDLQDLKIIMPFMFEDVGWVTTAGAHVKLNGKWGYSTPSGELLFPARYDSVYLYPNNYMTAFVRLNDKWGKVGMYGVEIIPILYDEIYGYPYLSQHVVRLNNKYGVYDSSTLVLPVKYDDFRSIIYEDERKTKQYLASFPTKAKIQGKWGYIDRKGVERTPFKYDDIDLFVPYSSSPLIGGRNDGKWGLINQSGEEVSPFKYDSIFFHITTLDRELELWKGVFSARYNGKWGLINQEGLEITPFKYLSLDARYNGIIFEVSIDGIKRGLISDKGKELTGFKYDEFKFFESPCLELSKNIAASENGKWFLIDTDGRVFDPKANYFAIMPFSEGLAPVLKEGSGWGFINALGKVIIPCQYGDVDYFWNGQAGVKKNGKWGIINKQGKTIRPFNDDENPNDPCLSEEY